MTAMLAAQQQDGILPADPARVSNVAFSPSGKLLASVGYGGTVRLLGPGDRKLSVRSSRPVLAPKAACQR